MYTLQTKVIARGALTIQEFHMLRQMPPSAAELWIKANKPDLEPLETADILAAVGDSYARNAPISPIDTRFPNRPQFIAAAWLAGASWGQLSCMFGVARATLLRSVERVLPVNGRQHQRLSDKISYSHLSLMRDKFLELIKSAPEGTRSLPPKVLASVLVAFDPHDQPGEYATGEDIQNRISGEASHLG